ncbi:9017_t:CDS:1 [Dentiscutata erythropus]|uniref:9017_t:CDS:1 n=1 Tax=Dentiscutata erythropus TaxID=1348616 RepID=A0A9N9HXK5_9GLOM|nr:9017_t:CDS:1 [Dentiscutata erythropus]
MLLAIRNLSRFVWVNVPNMNKNEIDSEKFAILDLLAGFALATKHYLREEDGTDAIKVSLDMRPLETKEGADSKSRLNKILKLLLTYRSKSSPDRGLNEPEKVVNYNLPLEITLYLNHYISQLKRRVNEDLRPDDPSITQMYANVSILVDCLTNLERVLRSPIPFAYAVHLSQTTCIFCLSLPFQLVGDLEWVTVPIVFLASVILLGVEEIANEIENPFGTDPNDLKLDQFCELLGMELDFVRSHNKIKSQWEETAKRAKTSEFNESNELDIKKESKGEISVVTEK